MRTTGVDYGACLLRRIIVCGVLTALDAAVVSCAARIATRNRRVDRRVAMLPNGMAVTRKMLLALGVTAWKRRYVAPVPRSI